MRILGIDPGSTATGYGVVDWARDGDAGRGAARSASQARPGPSGATRLAHVDHGIVRPPSAAPLAVRLAWIHARVLELATRHRPDLAVVEKVFVAANARSALVLGQARGAALAALAAADVEVGELTAREVKQAVVGSGAASKAQVQSMVMRLLGLDAAPPTDAADALAVAICQAHAGRLTAVGVKPRRRRMSRRALAAQIVGSRP
jgi:crossover junction endodeoxyribonuclease RuvC